MTRLQDLEVLFKLIWFFAFCKKTPCGGSLNIHGMAFDLARRDITTFIGVEFCCDIGHDFPRIFIPVLTHQFGGCPDFIFAGKIYATFRHGYYKIVAAVAFFQDADHRIGVVEISAHIYDEIGIIYQPLNLWSVNRSISGK